MSLILEDDNYVASKPHIFQNLLPHENKLHVCPAWLAASLMPMAWVLHVILGTQAPCGGQGLTSSVILLALGLRIAFRAAFLRSWPPGDALQRAPVRQVRGSSPAVSPPSRSRTRSVIHGDFSRAQSCPPFRSLVLKHTLPLRYQSRQWLIRH